MKRIRKFGSKVVYRANAVEVFVEHTLYGITSSSRFTINPDGVIYNQECYEQSDAMWRYLRKYAKANPPTIEEYEEFWKNYRK